ncbi:MAG TPA: hypothetical protein VGW09_00515, partial [Nitrososphaeraceae archaeon]|nr:hypothetical protein [Nitrososphaeraceae archaeon]
VSNSTLVRLLFPGAVPVTYTWITTNKKDGKERKYIQINSYHRLLSYPLLFSITFSFLSFSS